MSRGFLILTLTTDIRLCLVVTVRLTRTQCLHIMIRTESTHVLRNFIPSSMESKCYYGEAVTRYRYFGPSRSEASKCDTIYRYTYF